MKNELALMLGTAGNRKEALIDRYGIGPTARQIGDNSGVVISGNAPVAPVTKYGPQALQLGETSGAEIANAANVLPASLEQPVYAPQESSAAPGMGTGLMAGIPMALALMYLGNKTKGLGGKAYSGFMRKVIKHPRALPGYTDYMTKAALPIGTPGGFATATERLGELNKIFAELGKTPMRPHIESMLQAERAAVQDLVGATRNAPKFDIGKLWEQHGPKTLPGMLATLGAGGVALNAGDIASNMFGGSKRKGAPVIVNS